MKYRQYFGLTWTEFLDIPPEIFYSDLEMITIENEMEKFHEEKVKSQAQK